MHLNEGRFMQNGRCGYVLMPDCMFEPGFNPMDTTTHTRTAPITLTIQIIGGRHLVRQGRGICSPLVEVEVSGIDADYAKFRTTTSSKFQISIPILHCKKIIITFSFQFQRRMDSIQYGMKDVNLTL